MIKGDLQMTNEENIVENIVDMFFAQKTLYQKMTGEYVDKRMSAVEIKNPNVSWAKSDFPKLQIGDFI